MVQSRKVEVCSKTAKSQPRSQEDQDDVMRNAEGERARARQRRGKSKSRTKETQNGCGPVWMFWRFWCCFGALVLLFRSGPWLAEKPLCRCVSGGGRMDGVRRLCIVSVIRVRARARFPFSFTRFGGCVLARWPCCMRFGVACWGLLYGVWRGAARHRGRQVPWNTECGWSVAGQVQMAIGPEREATTQGLLRRIRVGGRRRKPAAGRHVQVPITP